MTITGVDALVFGVDDLTATHQFLEDWGLEHDVLAPGRFLTRDRTEILVRPTDSDGLPPPVETGPTVREVVWGVSDRSDLDVIAIALAGDASVGTDGTVRTTDPMGLAVSFRVSQRHRVAVTPSLTNAPGSPSRIDARAPFYERAVPHEISHVVFGVPDLSMVEDFYVGRLGFRVSDRYRGRAVFLRAAPNGNHHHLFVLNSADNRAHFNHVCFKVRDVHEVIGGGQFVAAKGWATQAGPGRHYLSSACFWYFTTPLGGAFEYAADEDMVTEAWQATEYEMSPEIFTEWTFNLAPGVAASMPIAASRPS